MTFCAWLLSLYHNVFGVCPHRVRIKFSIPFYGWKYSIVWLSKDVFIHSTVDGHFQRDSYTAYFSSELGPIGDFAVVLSPLCHRKGPQVREFTEVWGAGLAGGTSSLPVKINFPYNRLDTFLPLMDRHPHHPRPMERAEIFGQLRGPFVQK